MEIRIGACEKCIQLILKNEEEYVKEVRKMFNETRDSIINNVTEIKDAIKKKKLFMKLNDWSLKRYCIT